MIDAVGVSHAQFFLKEMAHKNKASTVKLVYKERPRDQTMRSL